MHGRGMTLQVLFACVLALSAYLVAGPARAEVVLQSQHRQLVTLVTVVAGGKSATDGDVFNDDETGAVGFQDSADRAIGENTALGQGEQISSVDPSGFTVTGYTYANAVVEPMVPEVFAEGLGATSASVHFDLTTDTEYWVYGSLFASGAGTVNVTVYRVDTGPVLELSPATGELISFDEHGVLTAGSYIYTFSSGGYAQAGFEGAVSVAHGDFDVSLFFLSEVSVPDVAALPRGLTLSPNPARSGEPVLIRLDAGVEGSAVIIADVAGRLVRRMRLPAGGTSIAWDARDARGVPAPPGIYFVRALGSAEAGRLVVLR